jgi:uncharacterized membrane protein YqhA
MRIFSHNRIALILLVVAFALLARCWPEIASVLANIRNIGLGHTANEKTLGLIALGMVDACLVAIVKILSRRPK